MKAVMVTAPGGADALKISDVADPEPGPGDLLVGVAAAGVNYIDVYLREGRRAANYPMVLGREGSGTVLAVGAGVDDFQAGDRVVWPATPASYAEMALVPASGAVALPERIDLDIGAALPIQGITAHYLTTDTYPLGPEDRCLIHAAAGGVGLLLTQMAKQRGAFVVATVGSDAKADLAARAGADHVINYTSVDFGEEVRRTYGDKSIDVVYDGVGAATFATGLDLLRPRGMMVTFGNASGSPPDVAPALLAEKGSLFLTRPSMHHYIETRQDLVRRMTELFSRVLDGTLDVRVGARFGLEEASLAHRALEGRATTGKILLLP